MSHVFQALPLPLAARAVLGVVAHRMGDDVLDRDILIRVLPDEDGGLTPASILHVLGPTMEVCSLRRSATMVSLSMLLGSV